jgi:hypothetical protein
MKVPVFALAGILVAAPALAWRDVTPQERTSIESVLAAQGCSGGVMKFDDDENTFEVDDARCNGRKTDVYLNQSFQVVRMTPDR